MKKILYSLLASLARAVVKKYRPRVIGVTGSVGKTSVKVLSTVVVGLQIPTKNLIKSYNNELGLPLTVLGMPSPGHSFFGWLGVFTKALGLLIFTSHSYPKTLVVEMGADHPGDLDYLIGIARPQVGVITGIGPAHTEYFKSVKKVLQEKQKIITCLKEDDVAILNADDDLVMSAQDATRAHIMTYGFSENADVCVADTRVIYGLEGNQGFPKGMHFKITYKGSSVPMELHGVVGEAAVRSAAGAIAVGLTQGLNLITMAERLQGAPSIPGRMRTLPGIKNTLIIDDTYNSSPKAAAAAVRAFEMVSVTPPAEKWLVLGDMRELGPLSEEAHEELGTLVAQTGVDHLVTIGELAKGIARGAQKAGFDEEYIFSFAHAHEAGLFIQEKLQPGSALLIKGSQAVRLEKVTKELMADPLEAKNLLVRQGSEWQ
jgi:UDP-N-acetylmuramoyl-tripeptide--D-alanyl-D-alanine ligase